MIRRTFPLVCLIDGAVRVAIEHWANEPQIWLHTDTARVRLSVGDAHVAAVMLQAAVAEAMGEAAATAQPNGSVVRRVADLMAARANDRAAKMGQVGAAVTAENFMSAAYDAVEMVREAERG